MQTFVVRVWVPGIEAPADETPLRGFVTVASSGVTLPFHEESELVALVKDAAWISARDDEQADALIRP